MNHFNKDINALLSEINFVFIARQLDLPEAAYFGPGARKAKGPKFAMNGAMDGVVNVS